MASPKAEAFFVLDNRLICLDKVAVPQCFRIQGVTASVTEGLFESTQGYNVLLSRSRRDLCGIIFFYDLAVQSGRSNMHDLFLNLFKFTCSSPYSAPI